ALSAPTCGGLSPCPWSTPLAYSVWSEAIRNGGPGENRTFTDAIATPGRIIMRKQLLTTTAAMLLAFTGSAFADMDAAKKFLDDEIGDMSSLDRAAQEAEMQWFIDAAKPFAGMDIKVVSETITTHEYESKVLAPAFT